MMILANVGMKPDFTVLGNSAQKERYARERAELQQILAAIE